MTKLLRAALVGAVIAAVPLLLAPAAAAEPATTEVAHITEYFDLNDGFGIECLGEDIHLQGEITYVVRSTETSSGNWLTAGHTIAHLTAVGLTTGTEYTLVDSRQITTNFLEANGEGFTGTGAWTYMLVGRGPGPNFILTSQETVTVTPDDTVVVDFRVSDIRCVG